MGESFKTKLAAFLAANLKEWPDGIVAFGPLTTFNGIAGRKDLDKFTSTPEEWNVAKDSTADNASEEVTLINKLQELGDEFGCPAGMNRIAWLRAALVTLQRIDYYYHGGSMWCKDYVSVEWDGEGIPPAGAQCEACESSYKPESGDWKLLQVLFSNSEYVFAVDPSLGNRPKIYSVDSFIFRKHETPEERAENRKQKAVEAMLKTVRRTGMQELTTEGMMSALFVAMSAGDIPGIPAFNPEK